MYVKFFKRLIDILLSLLGLVIVLPLFIILAIVIKIDSKGSVFFKQKRVGIRKTYFDIIKFRTMKTETPSDIPTHMFTDSEQYITKVGNYLRKTSLDEIPQLINIFFGQMSIIGPRPALWNQYDLITERDKYGANDVKPGLTGLAQINGRDELSIGLKAMFDGEYVKDINFLTDLKCFWLTVYKVIKKDGIHERSAKTFNDESVKKEHF